MSVLIRLMDIKSEHVLFQVEISNGNSNHNVDKTENKRVMVGYDRFYVKILKTISVVAFSCKLHCLC